MVNNSEIAPQIVETPSGKRLWFGVEQNTEAWYKLRAGIPTASGFHKIVTPAKGEPSAQAEGYMNHLLAERLVGHVLEFVSADMQEGHDRELESRRAFERTTKMKTADGGFWATENGSMGVSPDALIGEDGLLELKNPKASTHIGYIRSKSVEREYWVQLQSGLLISGRAYYYIQSYYPELPSVIMKVERDEEFVKKLATHSAAFCDKLEAEWQNVQKATS